MKKLAAILTLVALHLGAAEHRTNLKPDEQIVFYPTVAQRVAGKTNLWQAQIRGCVFEVEKRRLLLAAFAEAVELKTDDLTAAESGLFRDRSRLFLVDHERGKRVFVRIGTNEFFVGKSSADGTFGATILLRDEELERQSPTRRESEKRRNQAVPEASVPFAAVLRPGDQRIFFGAIFPLETKGVSVISDIDDTIKITDVRDKKATLRNTFLREFQPVPGMAGFYQTLARSPLTPSDGERVAAGRVRGGSNNLGAPNPNVTFHYISASPWQLYEPLAAFIVSNGFPAGTFELKEFRWKSRKFFNLFASPEKYKSGVIGPLLKQFPRRKFILIGDSGERDPEIYGDLARKFPGQIIRIYIRDVTDEPADSTRYRNAFRAVPRDKWQIFQEPPKLRF